MAACWSLRACAPTSHVAAPHACARSGVNVKTRKRNIVVPEDPASFANAVITLVEDASEEGVGLDAYLEAAAKALDTAELEFQRYGDVLFEVWFAGGRVGTGSTLVDDNVPKLTHTVSRLAWRIFGDPTRTAAQINAFLVGPASPILLVRVLLASATGAGVRARPRGDGAFLQGVPGAHQVRSRGAGCAFLAFRCTVVIIACLVALCLL